MEERKSEKDKVKSTPESEKSEQLGLSQLRDEESLGTTDTDMQDLHGVRENSDVEPNGEDIGEVKEMDSIKEMVASGIEPVDESVVENHEVDTTPCPTALSDPSMVEPSLFPDCSATQCLLLVSVPTKQEQISGFEVVKSLSVSPVLRTPSRDGYKWRKYGQKQVKSSKGSRSYYRCTYSECCAKKVECSNDLGHMIEIVNKGLHSHEPPRKNSFSPREIRAAPAILPVSEDNTVIEELPSVSDPPASTKENSCESHTIFERKRYCENEAVDETEPKRRLKKDNTQSSDYVSKLGKKQKFVVHAAGDVGISGDGYRLRKYGQKMVKGNSNPRNYYRCTSAVCSVRKHIETEVENTTALIITYKGVHNHDMPVPKKRHRPPSSMRLAAAAPTSMRTRSDDQVKQSSEALDVGGEKVMDSARTLLSIGFEIKKC